MSMETPDYQDEVQHLLNDVAGTVITIYEEDGITYLDVMTETRIYYKTPQSNWKTVVAFEEE